MTLLAEVGEGTMVRGPIACICMICLIAPLSASGDPIVITVAPDQASPADFTTIQGAIDYLYALEAGPGEYVVVVQPGTYEEQIDFRGVPVSVRADGDAGEVVIDGTGQSGSVVRFVSGETSLSRLEGFTITGGTGDSAILTDAVGGGVFCYYSDPIIERCVITANTANGGGGVFALASEVI